MIASRENRPLQLMTAGAAAFCTYFCMYAFRKPFTAGTFEGQEIFGFGLKTTLVIAQLAGYLFSKFVGIKVISEMRSEYRAASIIGMILFAELALVGFAFLPLPLKVVALFLNGVPLGMVFGLVLAYLEGRRQTEALSAVLCASFIMSSGVVKSVGRWLIQDIGYDEFRMPMIAGALFLPPVFISVWLLQRTPPPDEEDRRLRSERKAMSRTERQDFVHAYWPGLSILVCVYIALTIIRTVRDDFAVEIWRDMGVGETPSVFASSESIVAVVVTGLSALTIWITHNLTALRVTLGMMCLAFAAAGAAVALHVAEMISPFTFMVACGVGLYIPYVAYHTTLFERLIAASRRPCNLGFLMYLADAMGYLGYGAVIVFQSASSSATHLLPFFRWSLLIVSATSFVGLLAATLYFQRVFSATPATSTDDVAPAAQELATQEP